MDFVLFFVFLPPSSPTQKYKLEEDRIPLLRTVSGNDKHYPVAEQ